MKLTILLAITGCILLFAGIRGVTATMPTALLNYFPEDVREKLKPRAARSQMSFKRLPEGDHPGPPYRRIYRCLYCRRY